MKNSAMAVAVTLSRTEWELVQWALGVSCAHAALDPDSEVDPYLLSDIGVMMSAQIAAQD